MLSTFAVRLAQSLPGPVKRAIHQSRIINKPLMRMYGSAVAGRTFEIEGGPLKGIKLIGSEHTSNAHIAGTYERDVQEAIDRLVQPGSICYDLGASIGYMTLLMAKRAKHVYAFEPAPHAIAEIEKHTSANRMKNVTIVRAPISGNVRGVDFALTPAAYGSSIARDHKWPVLRLKTTTLDLFVTENPMPDFIKMDIEGEEAAALDAAHSILQERHTTFCIELHAYDSAMAVLKTLRQFGYDVRALDGSPVQIPDTVIPGDFHVVAQPSTEPRP